DRTGYGIIPAYAAASRILHKILRFHGCPRWGTPSDKPRRPKVRAKKRKNPDREGAFRFRPGLNYGVVTVSFVHTLSFARLLGPTPRTRERICHTGRVYSDTSQIRIVS